MSDRPPLFHIDAQSRFPNRDRDYDRKENRYTAAYLNPNGYVLTVDAFPGADVIKVIEDPEPEQGGPGNQEPSTVIKRLRIPADTIAFDFTVRRRNGGFEQITSKPID